MKHKIFTLFLALIASVSIIFAQSGTCGANLTWNLSNGTLTISGTGDMSDYSSGSAPWYAYYSSINKVIINDGVTSIGGRAFAMCNLTTITIPESVTNIGDYAFVGCIYLNSITINSDHIMNKSYSLISGLFTKFGNYAKEYILGDNVTAIGNCAFSNCSLTSITLGNRVKRIGEFAFNKCKNLTSITFADSLQVIETNAFVECTSLTKVTIPNSVTSIEKWAFASCSSLDTVVIGENVSSYGMSAFSAIGTASTVTLLNATPATWTDGKMYPPFDWNQLIYIPCGTMSAYQSSWRYSSYTYIKSFNFQYDSSCPPDINIYTVTFKDWDGTILKTEQVEEGQSATAPANPTREGYTFTGWDKSFTNVQSDLIVTALYTQNTPSIIYYTVTFKDWDGTILKTEQVEEGQSATAPANPTREGYTFTGWDKDFSNVQSDLIVTAQYTQNTPSTIYYTVTFKDWDGSILKTEQVEEGHSATAPANPTREGYTFVGWDISFTNVQSDLIVTAQYQKNDTPTNTITVSLKGSSASSWSKVNLYYWADGIESPAWPGITLSMDVQGWYSYTFPASVISVNIIWNDGNNQTADITNVTESTCYKLNSTNGKSIAVSTINCEEDIVAVTGVTLNKKTLQIEKGGDYTLTATVLPANATNKAVTWTSSNTAVATVSNTGKISAKTAGVSTISCETADGHFKAECYIVVTDASYECDYSFEPTTAKVIQFEATDLFFSAFDGGAFVVLQGTSHILYLMYYGSLVNEVLPIGTHPVSSIEQNGNILYSIGGDDTSDYGSFMATNFTADGNYSAAYYIIAGNMSVGANNSIYAKLVSVNGTDIIATYRWTQDIEIVPVEDGATKILRNGQIFILRGEKVYTLQGQEVK